MLADVVYHRRSKLKVVKKLCQYVQCHPYNVRFRREPPLPRPFH